MTQDPLTLYKLIILYMLDRVTFPITTSPIGDVILGTDYTNCLPRPRHFSSHQGADRRLHFRT